MQNKIISIIANIIKINPDEISSNIDDYYLGSTAGWYSLAHLSIMTELEDEYDLDLSIDEMENLDSVKKIIDFLRAM